jgi:hypothetical protein
MSYSTDVSAGDTILASHHNNLRKDVIDTSVGHGHNGTDSKRISTLDSTTQFNTSVTRYLSVSPAAFMEYNGGAYPLSFANGGTGLNPSSPTSAGKKVATINLPHGAIITSIKSYWYCNDGSAQGIIQLLRGVITGASFVLMASADKSYSSGASVVEQTSIAYDTIDNENYKYNITVELNPNDAIADISFYGVVIAYTVAQPLP